MKQMSMEELNKITEAILGVLLKFTEILVQGCLSLLIVSA